jgi:hypothetical protein
LPGDIVEEDFRKDAVIGHALFFTENFIWHQMIFAGVV